MKKSVKKSKKAAAKVAKTPEPVEAKGAELKVVSSREEYEQLRREVRLEVRTREDFQSMRKRTDNRLGRKADGTDQDLSHATERMPGELTNKEFIAGISDGCREMEVTLEKSLAKKLTREPVYNSFLSKIKGVGPIAAGYIISELNIFKADTVSKMWQYTGLNPDMVRGKKLIEKKDYKESDGQLIGEQTTMGKDGKEKEMYLVLTDTMIRADKLTEHFVSPFNQGLRTALVGVLADGFIKCRSPYRQYYDDYKNRLENSDKPVMHCGKMTPWKDVSLGHRDRAAKRYMIKRFLADLYNAWRPCYGLSVRPSYQEEKLGHKHNIAAM